MMRPHPMSVVMAFGVPVALLVGGVLLLGGSAATIMGIPVVFVYVFALFPVTSGLMYLAWRRYDRDADYPDDDEAAKDGA